MKKLKLLPLVAVGLLALVGCSGASNEIDEAKALSLYSFSEAQQYSVKAEECSYAIDTDPTVKAKFATDVFAKMPECEPAFITLATPLTCFFTEEKVATLKSLAEFFNEEITYTLDGKSLTAGFTGSTKGEGYGLAMNYSITYQEAGLVKSTQYAFSYAHEEEVDGKAQTATTVYHASVELVWQKA